MSIAISDKQLERQIEALGQRQPVPVKKTAMTLAILREAVRDGRGNPIEKWKKRSQRFSA